MKLTEKELRKEWERTKDLISRYYPRAGDVEYSPPEITDREGRESSVYDPWLDRIELKKEKEKDRVSTLAVTRAFITRLLHLSSDVSYFLAAHNPKLKKYWLGITVLRRLWTSLTGEKYHQFHRLPHSGETDLIKDFKM